MRRRAPPAPSSEPNRNHVGRVVLGDRLLDVHLPAIVENLAFGEVELGSTVVLAPPLNPQECALDIEHRDQRRFCRRSKIVIAIVALVRELQVVVAQSGRDRVRDATESGAFGRGSATKPARSVLPSLASYNGRPVRLELYARIMP
jgi:hypothetical protein